MTPKIEDSLMCEIMVLFNVILAFLQKLKNRKFNFGP